MKRMTAHLASEVLTEAPFALASSVACWGLRGSGSHSSVSNRTSSSYASMSIFLKLTSIGDIVLLPLSLAALAP